VTEQSQAGILGTSMGTHTHEYVDKEELSPESLDHFLILHTENSTKSLSGGEKLNWEVCLGVLL
jgi:hypothetical protein